MRVSAPQPDPRPTIGISWHKDDAALFEGLLQAGERVDTHIPAALEPRDGVGRDPRFLSQLTRAPSESRAGHPNLNPFKHLTNTFKLIIEIRTC